MDVRNEQSKVKESKINIYNPLTPLQRFEDFCQNYPLDINTMACQSLTVAYCKEVQNGISEETLLGASRNYAEACQILGTEKQFIKHPDNFLKDGAYLKYTDDNYVKPKKKDSKGGFNQFEQNNYDFDELEKDLLAN
jgi:hypothetical protein